ncbi:MAG: hypothetical protein WD851_25425 [Pirellulales bacterium]
MIQLSADLQTHWTPIAPILSLRNDQEHGTAVERLNALVDDVGTDENHPLYGLLDTLGTLVHAYEEEHERVPDIAGSAALAHLMEEHGLSLDDLPEIGDRTAVKNYLTGQQELSVKQVRALAQRFRVSSEVFIE